MKIFRYAMLSLAGAGSIFGTDIAAKSTPDGYTIILSDMPHTINPGIYAKVPYDPIRDFAPISVIGVSPIFLFVNPSVKAQKAADVRERFALLAVEPRTNTPQQFRALPEADVKRRAKIVKDAGIKIE